MSGAWNAETLTWVDVCCVCSAEGPTPCWRRWLQRWNSRPSTVPCGAASWPAQLCVSPGCPLFCCTSTASSPWRTSSTSWATTLSLWYVTAHSGEITSAEWSPYDCSACQAVHPDFYWSFNFNLNVMTLSVNDSVSGFWPGGGRRYLGPGLECAGAEEHAGSDPLLLSLPHEPGAQTITSAITLQLFCLAHTFLKLKTYFRRNRLFFSNSFDNFSFFFFWITFIFKLV